MCYDGGGCDPCLEHLSSRESSRRAFGATTGVPQSRHVPIPLYISPCTDAALSFLRPFIEDSHGAHRFIKNTNDALRCSKYTPICCLAFPDHVHNILGLLTRLFQMRNLVVRVQTSRIVRTGCSMMIGGMSRRREHPASATVQKRHYIDKPHGKLIDKLRLCATSVLLIVSCV
jgi:hypothetical protein